MKKFLVFSSLSLVLVLLLAPFSIGAVSTDTPVEFNVQSVVGFSLTLPGQSSVSANSTGAQTATIEFNSTDGTGTDLDPSVVGGASQSNGTPIFSYDNTGNVNINLSVSLDSDTPSCINMTGGSSYAAASDGVVIDSNTTIVTTGFGPFDGTQPWYLKADFDSCSQSDSATRTVTSTGVES